MIKKTWKTLGMLVFCGAMMIINSMTARADEVSGPALDSGNYIVTIDVECVDITSDESGQEVLLTADQGSVFQVLEDMGDGFVKVQLSDTYGFLPVEGNATITAADEEVIAEVNETVAAEAAVDEAADFRQGVVDYAMQFLGGSYAYGGSDPNTGVDCSGFTRYVMLHGAGIEINRSSTGQASQGVEVSADEMKPGDLIFYGNGKSINHVAMYAGDGQVVHASTYKTGIKTSAWDYRTPVKIVNVIGA